MKKYKIKNSFESPERPRTRVNKTGINFMIFILILVENCLQYDAIHDFSVWLELVRIQRILIGFEAILKKVIWTFNRMQGCIDEIKTYVVIE